MPKSLVIDTKKINPSPRNRHIARPKSLTEFYETKYALTRALLDAGKTYREIMAQTGLSKESVAKVSMGEIIPPQSLVDRLKHMESAKLTVHAHQCLDRITDGDYERAGLSAKVTSYAILFDKRQLLDGRPTVIGAVVRPPTELDVEIAALTAQIVER